MKKSHLSVALALAPEGSAVADNPLSIDGVLTSSDSIAIGYNGPDAPNQNTFYYDAFKFTINMDGVYTISIEALDTTLAPWIGVNANDYNPLDYIAPAPFALWGSELGGDTIGVVLLDRGAAGPRRGSVQNHGHGPGRGRHQPRSRARRCGAGDGGRLGGDEAKALKSSLTPRRS